LFSEGGGEVTRRIGKVVVLPDTELDFGLPPTARKKDAGGRIPGAWLEFGRELRMDVVGALREGAKVLGWEKALLVYWDWIGEEGFMGDGREGENDV
jgi:hypothetical protein